MSRLDRLYRRSIMTKLFTKGWGKPDVLRKLIENQKLVCRRESCVQLVSKDYPIMMEKRTELKSQIHLEGSFVSPFDNIMGDVMDNKNRIARFQMIVPKKWPTKYRPMCIHFAGTGDHSYVRRRIFLANRLVNDGIGSLIVVNPFYWSRKPDDQSGSSLNYLTDLFVMGGSCILECHAMLHWCQRHGYGPLAVHGISMGGHMATLGAALWPEPVSLVPCLSWTTASLAFIEGVLSSAISWPILTEQYYSDSTYADNIRPLIQSLLPSPSTHTAGGGSGVTSSGTLSPQSQPSVTTSSNRFLWISVRQHSTQPSGTNNTPTTADGQQLSVTSSTGWGKMLTKVMRGVVITAAGAVLRPAKQGVSPSDAHAEPSVEQNPSLCYPVGRLSGVSVIPVDSEVVGFMRELLDHFTHLGNYSAPVDPRLVTVVTAENDAYIPRQGVAGFRDLWPGSDIRILPEVGHIESYLRNAVWNNDFRIAIRDSLNHQVELYYNEEGPFGK